VSRMEQVEDAVGESYAIVSCCPPPLRFRPCSNLRGGVTRFQSLLMTNGWKCRTCSFFIGSLITSS
jgi:hypothetical protein